MDNPQEVYSQNAEKELQIAFSYYDSISSKISDNFLQEIEDCVNSILLNPFTYKIEFDVYHQAVVKKFPFVIIYTKINDVIFISEIFHTSQNQIKKFKQ